MGDSMTFPATFDEFAELYKIVDKQEVYTNGTELIPIFRVKQWLEHNNHIEFNKWLKLEEATKRHHAELFEEAKIAVKADTVREMCQQIKEYFPYDADSGLYVVLDQIAKERLEGEK